MFSLSTIGESIDYKNKTIYNDSNKDFQLDVYLSKQIDDKLIIGKRANAALLSEKYVYYCTYEGNEITIVNAIPFEKYIERLEGYKNVIRSRKESNKSTS